MREKKLDPVTQIFLDSMTSSERDRWITLSRDAAGCHSFDWGMPDALTINAAVTQLCDLMRSSYQVDANTLSLRLVDNETPELTAHRLFYAAIERVDWFTLSEMIVDSVMQGRMRTTAE